MRRKLHYQVITVDDNLNYLAVYPYLPLPHQQERLPRVEQAAPELCQAVHQPGHSGELNITPLTSLITLINADHRPRPRQRSPHEALPAVPGTHLPAGSHRRPAAAVRQGLRGLSPVSPPATHGQSGVSNIRSV